MLRYPHRWHDAANRLLDEEARLTRFTPIPLNAPGSTPDETPEQDEAERQAAEEVTDETRSDIAEALGFDEGMDTGESVGAVDKTKIPTVEAARTALEDVSRKVAMMHALLESMGDQAKAEIEAGTLPISEKDWKDMTDDLEMKLAVVSRQKRDLSYVDKLQDLQNVQIAPMNIIGALRAKADQDRQQFIDRNERDEVARMDRFLRELNEVERALRAREDGLPDVSTAEKWTTIPHEERLKVYEKMNTILGVPEALRTIQNTSLALTKEMGEKPLLTRVLEDFQKRLGKEQADEPAIEGEGAFTLHSVQGMWNKTKQSLGIEFYTPMQLYLAFQELKEAFLEVRKQKDRLQASKIAAFAGRALSPLPYFGRDFEMILENSQIKKNDEVKNGFVEALKAPSWDPGFDDLFKPGGIMDQNFHDKNRTRAILEYAASKGFLYELMDSSTSANKVLFGRWKYESLLPSEWTEQQVSAYWGNLPGDNTNGGEKRAELGKELTKNVDNADEFIESIDTAIKTHDLWFAKGVIERALDRGKSGNLSARIGVLVMERMRTDPLLRKVIPIGWMDKTGVLSAKTAAFTFGHFNFQRKYIYAWARSGETSMRGAGSLGRIIEDVKQDILDKDPALDPDKHTQGSEEWEKAQKTLNLLVGRVLASEIIEVGNGKGKGVPADGSQGGKIVSIFDRKFDFYNKGSGKQRDDEVDIEKLPDDFFNDPSEILLCDAPIISKILSYGSTRLFDHDFRAKMLFTHAGERLAELKKLAGQARDRDQRRALEGAAERFQTTFGAKIVRFLKTKVYPQTNTLPLTAFTLEDGTPAIMSMVRAGFVPLSVLEEGLKADKRDTTEFVEALLEQLIDDPAKDENDLRKAAAAMLARSKNNDYKKVKPRAPRPAADAGSAANASQPTISA